MSSFLAINLESGFYLDLCLTLRFKCFSLNFLSSSDFQFDEMSYKIE